MKNKTVGRVGAASLLLLFHLGCGGSAVGLQQNSDSGDSSTAAQGITITGSVIDDASAAANRSNAPSKSAKSVAAANIGVVLCKKYDGSVLATGSVDASGTIAGVVIPAANLDATHQVICQAVNRDGKKLLGHYDLSNRSDGDQVTGDIDVVTTQAIEQILSQCGEATSFELLDGCAPKIAHGVVQPTALFQAYTHDAEVIAATKDPVQVADAASQTSDASDTESGSGDGEAVPTQDPTPTPSASPVAESGSGDASTKDPVTTKPPTEIGSFMLPTINRHGLVAYYPFSGDANDASGNKNNGVVHGAQLIGGHAGQAYHFNGVSDFIQVAASKSLDIHRAITLSAWVQHDSTRSAQGIINKTPTRFPFYHELGGYRLSAWWANPNGYSSELYDGAHENECDSQHIVYAYNGLMGDYSKNPLVGVWTHVVSTWDGKTFTLYRDGVKQNSTEFTGSIASSDADLFIGIHPWLNQAQFNGTIDDVAIFNRALNESEVQDLMNGKITPFTATINIRPWNPANPIYLNGTGQIPVAILSTANFAAPSEVDPSTITFGRTGDEPSLNSCEADDVNRDGFVDLVCYFDNQQAAFQQGDTTGTLKAATNSGMLLIGVDDVKIVE